MDGLDPEPSSLSAKWTALVLKSLAGLGEGLCLGTLQYLVLRRIYPRLSAWRWIFYTSALAVAGWAVGSAIPLFIEFAPASAEPFDPPLVPLALASGALGAGLGLVFGLVQRLALRQAARNSVRWVYANAAGWGMALPVIYVAASIGDPNRPVWQLVATGLIAGFLAGLVLGVITGLSFRAMPPVRQGTVAAQG